MPVEMKAGSKLVPAMLVILMFGLLGCGRGDGAHPPLDDLRLNYSGKPRAMVLGTAPDKRSFFAENSFSLYDGYMLAAKDVYYSIEQPYEPPMATETTFDDDLTREPMTEYASERQGDTVTFAPHQGPDDIKLEFDLRAGLWELARADGLPVEIFHYSLKQDGTAFSILFGLPYDDTHGERLVAVYFTKAPSALAPVEAGNPMFNFLLGPGVKTSWPGDISISFCGDLGEPFLSAAETSVRDWSVDGFVGQRRLLMDRRLEAPPFSDLNINCLRTMPKHYAGFTEAVGFVNPIMERQSRKLKGSSLFVWLDEEDLADANHTDYFRKIVAHEFGHFLGIGHEFDEGAPDSVMSYDYIMQPTAHDFAAIEDLYGPYP